MSISTRITGFRAMMKFDNRWQLVFNRLLFKSKLDIYYLNECKILIDYEGGDAAGTRDCLVSNMYRQYLPSMKLGESISVLDVGANGGGFPLLLKLEGYSISKLICVEMNPNTFNRLFYNVHANFRDNCECINGALADSIGKIDLNLGNGSPGDSIYQQKFTSDFNKKTYSINTLTLDYLINGRFGGVLDIVKIDVEGAEYDVFLQKGCDLIVNAKYLLIEIHNNPKTSKEVLINKIIAYGFYEILAHHKTNKDVYCFANKHL